MMTKAILTRTTYILITITQTILAGVLNRTRTPTGVSAPIYHLLQTKTAVEIFEVSTNTHMVLMIPMITMTTMSLVLPGYSVMVTIDW